MFLILILVLMGAFCDSSGRPLELQPSRRCKAIQDLNFVVEKMVCVVGKGHYMFDSEEYSTVKTLSINTLFPDTYIAITGRHLRTVVITDGQVLCQNVDSPPNTKVVFGEHVCKPSAESTSDEASPEYENTSLANTTSSTEGLPAWVSSVISSTIVSLVCSVIGFGVYFIRRRILKKKNVSNLQIVQILN